MIKSSGSKMSGIIELDDYLKMIIQKIQNSNLAQLKQNLDAEENYRMIDPGYQLLHTEKSATQGKKQEQMQEQNYKRMRLNFVDSASKMYPHLFFQHITETLSSLWEALQDDDFELAQKERQQIQNSINDYKNKEEKKTYQNFISIQITGISQQEKREQEIFERVEKILSGQYVATQGSKEFHTWKHRQKLYEEFNQYLSSYLEDLKNLEGSSNGVIFPVEKNNQNLRIALEKQRKNRQDFSSDI